MMHSVYWMSRSLILITFFLNDTVALRHREAPTYSEVTLEWAAPAQFTSSVQGRELLLQFSQAITGVDGETLPKQLSHWIEAVSVGYDTMLIRSSREVTYGVRSDGNLVVIRLEAAPIPEPVAVSENEEGELRLQILRAQLLMARGQNGAAQRLLEKVTATDPGSVSALSNLAQVEQQIGRWRRSSVLYDRVLQLDPRNAEARELRSEVLAEQASRIRGDTEIKKISGGWSEYLARFSAHALLKSNSRLGMAVDHVHTISSSGAFDRQRAELYFRQDFENGSNIQLSTFGTQRGQGGGIRYNRLDSMGDWSAQTDYQRPFWEFLETIEGYGVRDRAEIHRNQRLGPLVNSRWTVAWNRYGLPGVHGATESFAYDGAISVPVWRSNPYLAVEYGFDKESAHYAQQSSIPLVSREVHAGSVTGQVRLSRRFVAEGFAGFVRDRLGEHGRGPFMGTRLTRGGSGRLGFQLWFERRRNSVATGQIVSRAGGYIYWRFQ